MAAHQKSLSTLLLCAVVAASAVTASGRGELPTRSRQAAPTAGATRIVSLVPAVTEMIYAMGGGDRVAGVSSYDRFPPEVASKPRVGALIDPDFERILSLRPDLLVVYGSQTDLIARLTRAQLPVLVYRHAGLPGVMVTIRQVGQRIGLGAQADQLASRIDDDLDDVRRRVAGRPRPRTALIFGREEGSLRGVYASGGIGFMHDLLETAGGTDVFADVSRENLQATTEILIARAPDVILEVRPAEGWTPDRIAKERALWRALPSLPAVRTNRVYLLADDRLSVPGPRVAEAARMIAAALHPGSAPRHSLHAGTTPRRERQ